jgi:hypothetical protein
MYAVTLSLAARCRRTAPGFWWLCVIFLINTIPLFFMADDDPRRLTMFPNSMMHLLLFALGRGWRRWRHRETS